jgi:hypothetical protein
VAPGSPVEPGIPSIARWAGGRSTAGEVKPSDWQTDAATQAQWHFGALGPWGRSVRNVVRGTKERPGQEHTPRCAGQAGNRPSRSRDWSAVPPERLRCFGTGEGLGGDRQTTRGYGSKRVAATGLRSQGISQRLPESADRQRSGGSSPRSASALRVGASNNSLRRQRDRRLPEAPTDFGPTMHQRETVEVAHDWRGHQRLAGPDASATGTSHWRDRMLRQPAPASHPGPPLPDRAVTTPCPQDVLRHVGRQAEVAEAGAVDMAARTGPEPMPRQG